MKNKFGFPSPISFSLSPKVILGNRNFKEIKKSDTRIEDEFFSEGLEDMERRTSSPKNEKLWKRKSVTFLRIEVDLNIKEIDYEDQIGDYFGNDFDLMEVLGNGSFSVVFRARKKSDGKIYAVKKNKKMYLGHLDR